ncbi:fimbria/pilus outer membrane usher protein [Pollutimonas thiosulfatoxidans]|nr:fimbria/pilus outer membrane usher protein [Pollutimonas thiosulfatoxidans]
MPSKPKRALRQLSSLLSHGVILGLLTGGTLMSSTQPAHSSSADIGGSSALPSEGSNAPVFLSTSVNGNVDEDLILFVERDGQLYLPRESALQLQFSREYLQGLSEATPLSDYPEVGYDYDRSLQRISISAPFSILSLSTTAVGGRSSVRAVASASPGLLLNYDLYSSYTSQDDIGLSGFTELRAFNNFGLVSSSHLFQGTRAGNARRWERTTVRMDTVLEHSLQDEQLTFRLGDTLTNGLPWSRRTRIGGFQVSRNFALQPYQTTAPLPAYFGTAALPSAVELYIDGIQQYTGQVPAGPFQLSALPTINGAGQAQVVLTDALGRRTSVDFPFYSSNRLLREGLTDWSFETGYVRANYGYQSFDYSHDPMASATIRHGFSNYFTAESHVEGIKGVVAGGVGAIFNIGTIGTVSGSWAQSLAQGQKGKQFTVGYELQRGPFGLGANVQRGSRQYRDVASGYGGVPVVRSDSAYLGLDTGGFGSISVNYAHLQQADQPRYRFGGVSWSRSFDRGLTLNISANQNLDERSDRSVYLNLVFNWDKGVSAYSSAVQSKGSRTYSAGANRSARNQDEWNWNVQAQSSEAQPASASGQASRRFQYLDFNAGANSAGTDQNVYAGASGSIVAMDGGVFASRKVYDGFAVVSTSGIPAVPVKSQNQLIGNTNSRGQLLVPSLQPYQHNKISIDPTSLPVDMRIKAVNLDVVPRNASGVSVKFAIDRVRAASLILRTSDDQAVPMGAQVYLNDSTEPAGWVGYDGRVYLEDLDIENRLAVHDADTKCTVQFSYRAELDTLPEIGPLVCV